MKGVVRLGGPQLGLTAEEAKDLCSNLDRVYANISADALFSTIPSALPHCLSDKRAKQGHYFAYYPPHASDKTPAIIFLHGYGGNFQFYIYLLKEEFPASIVLVPSWGASWENGTMQYLDDMLADVKRKEVDFDTRIRSDGDFSRPPRGFDSQRPSGSFSHVTYRSPRRRRKRSCLC